MNTLLDRMEVALTHMVWHGRFEYADHLEPIVEAVYEGQTVIAVLMAEEAGWHSLAADLRKEYGVRKLV